MQRHSEVLLTTLGEAIARRRIHAEMSQAELAERAFLQRTYVSDIERGQRNVTLLTLDSLAAALRCSAVELLQEAYTTYNLRNRRAAQPKNPRGSAKR